MTHDFVKGATVVLYTLYSFNTYYIQYVYCTPKHIYRSCRFRNSLDCVYAQKKYLYGMINACRVCWLASVGFLYYVATRE